LTPLLSSAASFLLDPYPQVAALAAELRTPHQRPLGLPVGNLTSQIWANAMLTPIDHLLGSGLGLGHFVRYCDDLLVYCHDHQRLLDAWSAVQSRCDALRSGQLSQQQVLHRARSWRAFAVVEGHCAPRSDANCAASSECRKLGNCGLSEGRCLPTDDGQCRRSEGCQLEGMCRLAPLDFGGGGRCLAVRAGRLRVKQGAPVMIAVVAGAAEAGLAVVGSRETGALRPGVVLGRHNGGALAVSFPVILREWLRQRRGTVVALLRG
jgi:hypothetical protein